MNQLNALSNRVEYYEKKVPRARGTIGSASQTDG